MTQVAQQERGAEERLVIASAAIEGGAAPASVLIAPWGEVRSANGTFVVDDESARLVIEAFRNHGTDVPIDYEHQSLGGTYASPTGQAPAAGWIKSLSFVLPEQAGDGEAGLVAEVAWTVPARDKLAAREYRYLSPVVLVRKSDRRVVALHSAALTNKPAIVGAKPIVNSCAATVSEGDSPVNAESVADDADAIDGAGEAVELLRLRLGLPVGCAVQEVLVSAEQRLAALTQATVEAEAEQRVAAALAAGKLTHAQRDWAMQLALKNPAIFDEWAASAPQVVLLGRTRGPAADVGGGRGRVAIVTSARASYRAQPGLEAVTSEAAWVAQALREAGFDAADEGE